MTPLTRTLSWTSSNNAIATVNSGGLVTGVAAGTVTITASTSGVSGAATVTVTDPNPPAAPSGLTATTVSNSTVDLAWTDNSNNESSFIVERETGGASGSGAAQTTFTEVARPTANSTTFRDTGLSGGTIYRYRVRATNGNGDSGNTSTVETSTFGVLAITNTTLPDGTIGTAYSAQMTATGGSGTPTWSLTLGSLPDGLSLAASGAITGTPTVEGTFTFTIQAEGGGQQVFANFSVDVGTQILAPLVADVTLPTGLVGTAYTQTLTATRGDGSFTWSQNGGSLPPGIALTFGGIVLGTPTQAGTFTFGAQALSAGLTGIGQITVTVFDVLAISTAALPGATVGGAYSATLTSTGGNGTNTWSATGLPDGVTISTTGVISGTPTAAGSHSIAITVTSGDGQTAQKTLPLVVTNALTVTTASLSDGQVGVAYSAALAATGGTGSITWAISSGSLPAGLSLSAAGTISGTPSAIGAQTFTVQATSGDAQTATKSLTITIAAGAVTVTTSSLAGGTVGAAYSATLQASGGNGTFTWSLLSGSLPTGLNLSAAGVISGTPTTAETANFTVQASSAGQTGSAALSITIAAGGGGGGGGAFNIELVYGGVVSAQDQAVFEQAAQKWERVITGDLEDYGFDLPAACGHPTFSGGVDDLKIYVEVKPIDGAFNTLASAGACYTRVGGASPGKPLSGIMTFDSDDMQWLRDNNALINTVLHEMGHVLGIGAGDSWTGLRTGDCLMDVRFTGPLAVAAWNAIGGAGNVPVENGGAIDDGSNCSHWRETILKAELMTPNLDAGVANPLSLITVQSLADMGWSVNTGEAESFSLTPPPPAAIRAPRETIRMINDSFAPRFGITMDGVIIPLNTGGRR